MADHTDNDAALRLMHADIARMSAEPENQQTINMCMRALLKVSVDRNAPVALYVSIAAILLKIMEDTGCPMSREDLLLVVGLQVDQVSTDPRSVSVAPRSTEH